MKKISRYILVFITIIASAVALPELYWLAFEKPIHAPFVMYSCIDHDFMIQRYDKGLIRMDNKGKQYTRDEFELKLPLFFIRQLLISGAMPDTINGIAMDVHDINKARSFFRFRARAMIAPDPGLYPLFESESGRANLEMPEDFFRINRRMEFINAKENKVCEEKSRMFTAVLQKAGFDFPAKKIAGIPTTRKTCDEGYLVIDKKDQLFHIKMVEARPYVKKVEVPLSLKFKHIACVDLKDKKYYSYLVSTDNEIYILTQGEYELIKLPIEGFIAEKEELRIYGNLFYYTIISRGENFIKVTVLDDEYNKIDEYNETWTKRSERIEGKVFGYIYPAQVSMADNESSFTNFYFERTKGYNWLFLNVLLIIVHFGIIRKGGLKLRKNLLDFAVVAVTGIFGFLAVNFFQNKFFD